MVVVVVVRGVAVGTVCALGRVSSEPLAPPQANRSPQHTRHPPSVCAYEDRPMILLHAPYRSENRSAAHQASHRTQRAPKPSSRR